MIGISTACARRVLAQLPTFRQGAHLSTIQWHFANYSVSTPNLGVQPKLVGNACDAFRQSNNFIYNVSLPKTRFLPDDQKHSRNAKNDAHADHGNGLCEMALTNVFATTPARMTVRSR